MFFIALSLFVQVAAAQSIVLRTFDDDKIGAPPAGFVLAAGRDASPDQWSVQPGGKGRRARARRAPVAARQLCPRGVQRRPVSGDAEISVRLKVTGGGRSAGLVFKYQDPMNHYAVQLDLANQDLAMYRVVSGNRIRVEREDDLELDPDAWHSLKVVQDRDEIRVYLGGIRVFTDRDRTPRTPLSAGLWSAGDTTVLFDDFRVEPDYERRP